MTYREIHFDSRSESRTLGDNNQPKFIFNDPIYLKKFGLKTCQVPLSFYNCHTTQAVFNVQFLDTNNVEIRNADVNVLAGLYYYSGAPTGYNGLDVMSDRFTADAAVNGCTWTSDNGDASLSADTYSKIGLLLSGVPAGADANIENVRIRVYLDTIFASIIGYHPSQATNTLNSRPIYESAITGIPAAGVCQVSDASVAANYITEPTKFQNVQYLYLRSDMAYGAHYLPNSGPQANYSMSNVLARVPIKTAVFARESYAVVDIGTLDPSTMFTYNGEYLDKATFWFTYADSEQIVDFRNKNFVFTLGIITERNL